MNTYFSIPEPLFVLQISQLPKVAQNWFCIQNLHMELSFQMKKKDFEIRSLVLEKLNKQTFERFFLNALYLRSESSKMSLGV